MNIHRETHLLTLDIHSVWPVCRNSVNAKGRGLAFSKRRNAREAHVQNELMLLRAEVARHAQPAI